ncbi:molecular chaperone [Pseudomonas sp. 148P]|uniref:Molecular chaperone n=1 Tax=Pseudomonas ulcerans TaxID=3115852 RepID=A0ABU7HPE0_9PSED|nr:MULTISPECIES: molecular chaperone [unclassified Pseudomonas]MEE1920592.1 molecular chaperone [Pseudomonas sp. 147P]MEE1933374.1 molecular chaperone [Pseudomonas sp. 148P]
MPLFHRPAWPLAAATLALLAWLPAGHAALSLNSTRVVFDSDKRNVSLVVNNPSRSTFAVQTWVNTDADDTTTAVPLIASPPLFRLDPGTEQLVQINALPATLPEDRESLFFFNVQEIPEARDGASNVLNIALRTRIKLFYRPVQLGNDPMSRLGELHWSIERHDGQPRLVVHNPTPFHFSFSRLELLDGERTIRPEDAPMVAPLSRQTYPLASQRLGTRLQVTFAAINDYGGYSKPLTVAVRPGS